LEKARETEIHGLTPVVLAKQVPFKILRGKILDLCCLIPQNYSYAISGSFPPLALLATGLLCIYGALAHSIIARNNKKTAFSDAVYSSF